MVTNRWDDMYCGCDHFFHSLSFLDIGGVLLSLSIPNEYAALERIYPECVV